MTIKCLNRFFFENKWIFQSLVKFPSFFKHKRHTIFFYMELTWQPRVITLSYVNIFIHVAKLRLSRILPEEEGFCNNIYSCALKFYEEIDRSIERREKNLQEKFLHGRKRTYMINSLIHFLSINFIHHCYSFKNIHETANGCSVYFLFNFRWNEKLFE